MKTTKKEVEFLFKRVCNVYNLPTSAKTRQDNPEQDEFYSNDFYQLDYNSYYGGYAFLIVMTSTGQCSAFDTTHMRFSKYEAVCFLSGLLAAKNLIATK